MVNTEKDILNLSPNLPENTAGLLQPTPGLAKNKDLKTKNKFGDKLILDLLSKVIFRAILRLKIEELKNKSPVPEGLDSQKERSYSTGPTNNLK
jgi:hypothetical protein